jgi:hypothetical protein
VPKRVTNILRVFDLPNGEPIWTGNGVVGRSTQPFWLRRVWQIASAIVWFCRLDWQLTTSRQFGAANQDLISITPVLYHPFGSHLTPDKDPLIFPGIGSMPRGKEVSSGRSRHAELADHAPVLGDCAGACSSLKGRRSGFIMSRCLGQERTAAIVSIFGIATASIVHAVASALGLSAIRA